MLTPTIVRHSEDSHLFCNAKLPIEESKTLTRYSAEKTSIVVHVEDVIRDNSTHVLTSK